MKGLFFFLLAWLSSSSFLVTPLVVSNDKEEEKDAESLSLPHPPFPCKSESIQSFSFPSVNHFPYSSGRGGRRNEKEKKGKESSCKILGKEEQVAFLNIQTFVYSTGNFQT